MHSQGRNSYSKGSGRHGYSKALSWLKLHDFDRVNVESDALTVVQKINRADDFSSFDLLVLDINDSISKFSDLIISFTKRSANWVAHLLAWKSISVRLCGVVL